MFHSVSFARATSSSSFGNERFERFGVYSPEAVLSTVARWYGKETVRRTLKSSANGSRTVPTLTTTPKARQRSLFGLSGLC